MIVRGLEMGFTPKMPLKSGDFTQFLKAANVASKDGERVLQGKLGQVAVNVNDGTKDKMRELNSGVDMLLQSYERLVCDERFY